MTFFESLLILLLAAIILLQVSRRLSLPYPAMLAGAGVLVALIPGSPVIRLEPATALALFIAPALMDAAYDFPLTAAKRFWLPLFAFAVLAVLVTAGVVTWFGSTFMGLPFYAALALGAIVAPPDAAAATAVLRSVTLPRSSDSVLKGESLFNDASALLLFNAAIQIQSRGSLTSSFAVQLGLAVPGGILLGIAFGYFMRWINPLVKDTLGGNVLQFVFSFLIWVVAVHLHLSAVLCIIAFAMTIANRAEIQGAARMRVHSYAVWSSVVFTLNVLAFLIMGMQTRIIVLKMGWNHVRSTIGLAGVVVIAVVLTRMIFVVGFNRLVAWNSRRKGEAEPASTRQALLVGWSGMRGLVTLATAFSLPANFPQRDLIVLTAFSVVLFTLVFQGLTLPPLLRLLKLDDSDTAIREITGARVRLADAAIMSLTKHQGTEADNLRFIYTMERDAAKQSSEIPPQRTHRKLGRLSIQAERLELERIRANNELGSAAYLELQEELDWRELTFLRDSDRKIEEI